MILAHIPPPSWRGGGGLGTGSLNLSEHTFHILISQIQRKQEYVLNETFRE
jgi:hypothetical protein